ncbi:hypothetical protein, partial [Paraburkholderia dipogonis]|uniref:hypothetical protein n=1 Tax=Paraburkholderia dipogonis TaxID=1211383 RepID=UPI0038BBC017
SAADSPPTDTRAGSSPHQIAGERDARVQTPPRSPEKVAFSLACAICTTTLLINAFDLRCSTFDA